jgi:hypothetical protein
MHLFYWLLSGTHKEKPGNRLFAIAHTGVRVKDIHSLSAPPLLKEFDMCIASSLHVSIPKNIAVLATIIIALLIPTATSATVINFNDLKPVYNEEFPCWCDNPLSDQYIDQGLLISGAWVVGSGPNNGMLTSNWAGLKFVGDLPTFLSMNITSHYGDAIFLEFYGESGYLDTIITSGWLGYEDISTPVIPNQLISFNSDIGIKSVAIHGFFNMRLGADIDNITFTHSAVPEPSSVALISLGLLGLLLRRRNIARPSGCRLQMLG